MMNIVAFLLSKLGFGGLTLDKAIEYLVKMDKALEEFEAAQKAEHLAEEQKIADAEKKRTEIEAGLARAARIRGKIADTVS